MKKVIYEISMNGLISKTTSFAEKEQFLAKHPSAKLLRVIYENIDDRPPLTDIDKKRIALNSKRA